MTDERTQTFVDGLTKQERVLVVIRDELYGGSWDELKTDLEARQNRKPFVFKLNTRIEEDLSRIEKLRAFERDQGIDLRPLLEDTAGPGEGLPL